MRAPEIAFFGSDGFDRFFDGAAFPGRPDFAVVNECARIVQNRSMVGAGIWIHHEILYIKYRISW